jgi:DNA (cytosine-5)-methyltransferase 1
MIEIVIDNFAGGGGASTGIEAALGRPIDYAVNHDRFAIAMHKANHPHTEHLTEDVWKVDPLALTKGRRVSFAWFSPDCTYFSKARGAKPFRDPDVARRVRGLAGVVVKWAKLPPHLRPRIIFMENVEEFQGWGPLLDDGTPCPLRKGFTFRRWWKSIENCGYVGELRELYCHDYGAPTKRKRLFIIFRCDGLPITWPERTHGFEFRPYRTTAEHIDWSIPVPSIFFTKQEAKDWSKYYGLGTPHRPLADATMRRIARGVFRYVIDNPNPFVVSLTHHGAERVYDLNEQFPTITTAHRGELALVTPFLTEHANASSQRNFSALEPSRTQCANVKGGHFALVSAFLSRHFGQSVGQEATEPAPTTTCDGQGHTALVAAHIVKHCTGSIGFAADEPAHTICAGSHAPETNRPGGSTMGIVAAHIVKHCSDSLGYSPEESAHTIIAAPQQGLVSSHVIKLKGTCRDGHPVDEPLHTIQSGGCHYGEVRAFLMKYYGTEQKPNLNLSLITTRDRFALVTVRGESYAIVDIGMRMFTPRELFSLQGFSPDYIIDPVVPYEVKRGKQTTIVYKRLTKTDQIRMCGNSVPPQVAEALVRANYVNQRAEAAA